MSAWRVLPLVLLLAACGFGRPPGPAPPLSSDDTARLVARAEREAQAGKHAEAARLFEEVLRRPKTAFADRALVGLTRLLVDSENAGRDYRRAHLLAVRLVREHPDSAYAAEARSWRDLLDSYLTQGQELERRARELEGNTRRLQTLDQDLQERSREVERLSQELKRLKILDVELERRTQELERLSYELDRRNRELQRLKRLDLELEQQKKKP